MLAELQEVGKYLVELHPLVLTTIGAASLGVGSAVYSFISYRNLRKSFNKLSEGRNTAYSRFQESQANHSKRGASYSTDDLIETLGKVELYYAFVNEQTKESEIKNFIEQLNNQIYPVILEEFQSSLEDITAGKTEIEASTRLVYDLPRNLSKTWSKARKISSAHQEELKELLTISGLIDDKRVKNILE